MKLGWILPILLLGGLIAVPDQTVAAASDAALLWWTRVLPSLLPYLIAASLLERSGILLRAPKRLVPLLLWLFGAIGGYPIGAKLAGSLRRSGVLTESEAGKAAAFCNLPNPVFLVSVVALGIFRRTDAIAPLLIGVYGISALNLVPLYRIRFAKASGSAFRFSFSDLPPAIESGVRSILIIGGCMMFASVLGALLKAAGIPHVFASVTGVRETAAYACLLGFFEMTCGIRAVSLVFPLRFGLAACACLIQFGGGSVLLQTASLIRISLLRYTLFKLLLALVSAAFTYMLVPLFCPETVVPTFASRAEMANNGYVLLSVCLSAAIGLLSVFALTFGLSHRKKAP